MTKHINRDGTPVLVRLTDHDLRAIELIREYMMTMEWRPYHGCRTQAIRFALHRAVAALAEEVQRKEKRRGKRRAAHKRRNTVPD